MKTGGTSNAQLLHPEKALFVDFTGGLSLSILLLLLLLINGADLQKTLLLTAIISTAFVPGILLYFTKWFKLSIPIYLIAFLIMIAGIAFFLPEIKYESLLLIPLGITGFWIVESHQKAISFFLVLILLCLSLSLYEFYFQKPEIPAAPLLHQPLILFFIAYLALKIVLLVNTNWLSSSSKVESSQQDDSIFQYSHEAMLVCNPRSISILKYNEAASEIFDLSSENLTLEALCPALQADGQSTKTRLREYFLQVKKNHKPLSFEFLFKRHDGEIFTAETTLIPANDAAKEIIITIRDNSEKEKSNQALRASEERLRSIVETSPNGITVIDLKGNLTFMSKRSLEIFGTNMEDRLGRSLLDTIHPEDHFKVKEGIGALIAGLEPPYRRFRGIYSNGSIFHIEATARYLENSLNEKKEILIVFNDITDKLLAEQELKRYVDLSKELENFAQVAAHDLQAPLRNIISFTKLLQKSVHSKLNQKEKEYFEFIVSATSGMNKLINSLLLYLKINASPTEFTAINPKSMLDLIIVESEAEIKSRNARINYPEKLPDTIYADKTKLKVLFQHLLCNALKFSKPDDNPVIHIRLEDQNHSWYFEIEDNGIGIKPEFQRKIFKIFQRLNSRQAYKGAGIGLALCKMIVEQHHGKIGLHSTFGKGSTFYFTINKESPVLN